MMTSQLLMTRLGDSCSGLLHDPTLSTTIQPSTSDGEHAAKGSALQEGSAAMYSAAGAIFARGRFLGKTMYERLRWASPLRPDVESL